MENTYDLLSSTMYSVSIRGVDPAGNESEPFLVNDVDYVRKIDGQWIFKGAVITVGPASCVKPFLLKTRALPPRLESLSTIVTSAPRALNLSAMANPPKPLPTTTNAKPAIRAALEGCLTLRELAISFFGE